MNGNDPVFRSKGWCQKMTQWYSESWGQSHFFHHRVGCQMTFLYLGNSVENACLCMHQPPLPADLQAVAKFDPGFFLIKLRQCSLGTYKSKDTILCRWKKHYSSWLYFSLVPSRTCIVSPWLIIMSHFWTLWVKVFLFTEILFCFCCPCNDKKHL